MFKTFLTCGTKNFQENLLSLIFNEEKITKNLKYIYIYKSIKKWKLMSHVFKTNLNLSILLENCSKPVLCTKRMIKKSTHYPKYRKT